MTPEVKNIIVQKRHSCHVQVILIEKQCDLKSGNERTDNMAYRLVEKGWKGLWLSNQMTGR